MLRGFCICCLWESSVCCTCNQLLARVLRWFCFAASTEVMYLASIFYPVTQEVFRHYGASQKRCSEKLPIQHTTSMIYNKMIIDKLYSTSTFPQTPRCRYAFAQMSQVRIQIQLQTSKPSPRHVCLHALDQRAHTAVASLCRNTIVIVHALAFT